jgi:hypothetical protein
MLPKSKNDGVRIFHFLLFGWFAFPSVAFSKELKTFYDYLTSSEYECAITSKRIFKPGTVDSSYDLASVRAGCMLAVSCRPVDTNKKSKAFTANPICRASDLGVCEEPFDCAKRGNDGAKEFGSKILDVASTAKDANNKFGDVCWETNGVKDRRGTLQLLGKDGRVLEESCATSYVCKGRPNAAVAACATASEITKIDGVEKTKIVCPQLNDCINADLTIPGFTKKELDEMSPEQRERAMRQYEEGVDKLAASSKTLSTLPRQSTTSPVSGTPIHTPKK